MNLIIKSLRIITILCGMLAIGYWATLTLAYGRISFAWVFFIGGLLLVTLSLTVSYWIPLWMRLRTIIRVLFIVLIGSGVLTFIAVESFLWYIGNTPSSNYGDTIVVLGAGLRNGDEISASLQYRLEEAISLHKKTPDANIVVSGGQGADETISEALAMKNYLVQHGVDEELIRMEDTSTNTSENLLFTKQLLEAEGSSSLKISLITNDFHMYRAQLLAENIGFDVYRQPSDSIWTTQAVFYTREFFGMMRCWLLQY